MRFAGAAVLSSSKGEYWKVHNDDDDDKKDYEEVDYCGDDDDDEERVEVDDHNRDGRLAAEVCCILV